MAVVTLADSEAKRAALRAAIWPAGGYPLERRADRAESWWHPYWGQQPNYCALRNLDGLTRLHVDQRLGVNVRPIHFRPTVRRSRGLVFAQGHDAGPWYPMPRNVLYRFLLQGFDVVTVGMPLTFMEARPDIDGLRTPQHDFMGQFQTEEFNPLAWFLEPPIAALNRLRDLGCADVSMIGYSGGGWATTLLAALDARIARSYPVAGSLPLDLRQSGPGWNDWGDWEQFAADIWQDTDYRDLYLMAADRPGRSQVQVLNQYDPVGFKGDGREQTYAPTLAARAAALGGAWRVWVDRNRTEHAISDLALNEVMKDLGIVGGELW